MWRDWIEILFTDEFLYLSVSCIVSLLLLASEIVLLKLRERAILGHLGWTGRDLGRESRSGRLTGHDEA